MSVLTCGRRREIIAFVTDPIELAPICNSLGVASKPPPLTPARSPPQEELGFPDEL